jgi:hypothetical protein
MAMTREETNARNLARYHANKERYSEVRREYHSINREKINANKKVWKEANPDKVKNQHLLKKFGITLEQFNEMLAKQNGVCAICEKPETLIHPKSGKIQDLCVDHDHETGKVRGLLCTCCNKAIGLLNDSKELVEKAAKYLERKC